MYNGCPLPLSPFLSQVFDTDRARMEKEYDTSAKSVHDLKRDYERLLKTTGTQKKKLEGASDPKAEEK